jgi:adenylate cyclase
LLGRPIVDEPGRRRGGTGMLRQALVRLGFRFADDAQERLFVERFVLVHTRTVQLFMAASGVMFALFALWDREVDPVRWRHVFALREFVLTPVVLVGAAALFAPPLRRRLETIVAVVVTTALVGFTVICASLDQGFRYGAAGMLLIYFAGAAMFPVRLIFLTAPSAVILFGFLGVEAWTHSTSASMMAVNGLVTGTAVVIGSLSTAGRELAARREFLTDLALVGARARVDDLLHSMMPREIVSRIQAGETTIADIHGEVSIVFADLVGFTALSRQLSASTLVGMLNTVFSRFDAAAGRLGIEKIKTIGDA